MRVTYRRRAISVLSCSLLVAEHGESGPVDEQLDNAIGRITWKSAAKTHHFAGRYVTARDTGVSYSRSAVERKDSPIHNRQVSVMC